MPPDAELPADVWTPETPVIIAANRLPVRLFKDASSQWQVEWAGDRMIESQNTLSHCEISERATIKFVGRVADLDVPLEERQAVELLLRELHCYPVFVEAEEAKLYYEDYCKQTLWPTFHNVVDVYSPVDVVLDVDAQQQLAPSAQFWNPGWQKVAWQAYANVNQLFAHKICDVYEPGDVVWVQDYHLLLTPSYIVRKLRAANVGLFLHVPFPSSEVFRTLSMRKELLRGMLNADHIGFHLFEYARHFMSACRRILGLSYEPILRGQLGIDYGGRRVAVTCSHMAIDAQRIEETLASDDVREMVVELRQKYRDKKIFAGCDTIERLKGIPSKMLAFDGFLSRCPDFIGKAVLVQKGIHRRGRVTDYMQSKREIELAVQAINNKYRDVAKGDVVDYEEVDEFPYKERVALWRVADVQITTVLRDGLNTTPFEYIATHKTSPGVLIMSEFSGSSRLLSGALTVNPWELDQVIDALRDAVYMPANEREHRRNCDFQFVSANPPRRWAKCVLTDIVNARKKEESFVYMGTGFGLDFRLMEVSAHFRKLTEQEIAPGYRTSTNRAIFLDYYRTLAPDVSKVMGVRWPDVPLSALATLEQLCKDPRNTVFIVSGCNCDLLTQKFGGVPGLGLVAEHGYFIRRAVLGNNARIGRPWERHGDILQTEGGHQQWRIKAEKIIQLYVDRTNGSTLELRRSAVLFRYGKSDFDFGALQAAELKEHLEGVFEGWPLNIIQGKDYIEVRPEGVGKGKIVSYLLNKMRVDGNAADFVLCIGDDVADELMFDELKKMVAHEELPKDKVFTCTVGQKPSKAEFFVDDYTDVIALLKSMKVVATKSNRNYSLSDMQSFVRDTRPFLSSSSHGNTGVPRSATSDSVIRKSSSRHGLHNHLTPVIEDQIVPTDLGGGRYPSPTRRKNRNKWLNRLQQLGVVAILVGILRWRSGVKNPHEKKLLMYLVASLGIAWSIQRVRSKSQK
ncbi:putative alpha,alpha-trehalose-phosphate synthase [UDP-forming] 9 [Phytophthora rubi]|uniref:Putative alpha,alpha-trehalose-phosphate synthase [UDP-forming] 9 n=1 Tax=Phytophthora rubi TaxID=129364 RepID=A0A6A4EV94_9STRA|nr:putative alpha,alpha-trehalose-phosphate synthase [UDP-forming] 9 [Phytophthora rubi]KAE9021697.1 putative alpha,alpha-trehalose-phosphate synthase [UDP-forming] 9 [Phytophthora rubi]KAE9332970.1 putative alpha,alpha-trehalose-phosphate synthase [UDP-forming] 9 [Phytophthora rubi]